MGSICQNLSRTLHSFNPTVRMLLLPRFAFPLCIFFLGYFHSPSMLVESAETQPDCEDYVKMCGQNPQDVPKGVCTYKKENLSNCTVACRKDKGPMVSCSGVPCPGGSPGECETSLHFGRK